MRSLPLLCAAFALLLASAPAGAYTVSFGTPTNLSTCSLAGNGADRSCTNTASVSNGSLDAVASLNVRGQASADHGLTTNATAIADITVTYDIPYTITRTVQVTASGVSGATMSIPVLGLTFNATFSGSTAHDNSQTAGGLANAVAYTATLSDSGGNNLVFGSQNYAGSSNGGGGGPTSANFTRTTPDPSATLTGPYQGAVGEIDNFAQVPTNFRVWADDDPSYANAGNFPVGSFITQTYSDVIRVSFRLRAESRPSGSVSTTGGEAIACAGQSSPLGGFALDPGVGGLDCGSGFSITASLSQVGTYEFMVPEPQTAALLGASVLGLVWMVRRSRQG
jgi:hypothetical protein